MSRNGNANDIQHFSPSELQTFSGILGFDKWNENKIYIKLVSKKLKSSKTLVLVISKGESPVTGLFSMRSPTFTSTTRTIPSPPGYQCTNNSDYFPIFPRCVWINNYHCIVFFEVLLLWKPLVARANVWKVFSQPTLPHPLNELLYTPPPISWVKCGVVNAVRCCISTHLAD